MDNLDFYDCMFSGFLDYGISRYGRLDEFGSLWVNYYSCRILDLWFLGFLHPGNRDYLIAEVRNNFFNFGITNF